MGPLQIHLILQMLKLDEEIKGLILKLDDSDPGLRYTAEQIAKAVITPIKKS